jgi:hypothetical protein
VLELLEPAPSDFVLDAAGLSAAGVEELDELDDVEDEDFSASIAFLRDSEG